MKQNQKYRINIRPGWRRFWSVILHRERHERREEAFNKVNKADSIEPIMYSCRALSFSTLI